MDVLSLAREWFEQLRYKATVRKHVRAILAPLSINAMREVLELGNYHSLAPSPGKSAFDAAFDVVSEGLPRALRVIKPDQQSLAAFALDGTSTPEQVVAAVRKFADHVKEAGGTPAQADLLYHRMHSTLTGVPIDDGDLAGAR